ncbi:hypothetical protein LIHA111178_05950 [Litorimonas haliclonae]
MLGLITLEILKKLETELSLATGKGAKFRLGMFFDFIAGNSTGSIIATGLALGMTVDEIIEFYIDFGDEMFSKNVWFKRFRSKYNEKNLQKILQDVTENKLLGSDELTCLLLVVLQNASTNSTWLISNNPHSKYNEKAHKFCNLNLPLWQLVRASTAAPSFFSPEEINVNAQNRDNASFYFVDGGVSAHNNPALALYRTVSMHKENLSWREGEQNLLLVSIGTGNVPRGDSSISRRGRLFFKNAAMIPTEMISTLSAEQDINCRFLGRCLYGASVDRELGDMIPRDQDGIPISEDTDTGKRFSYIRYNPDLSSNGLTELGKSHISTKIFREMDNTKFTTEFREVGRKYAVDNVKVAHMSKFY